MAVDDAYTKVLLHLNGTEDSTTIVDESGKTWTAHDGAVLKVATPDPKFGSAYLNPMAGGYISTPAHADFDLGSGDFTIDFWTNYYTGGNIYSHGYFKQYDDASNFIRLRYQSGNLEFVVVSGGVTLISKGDGFGYGANQWRHYAIVRYGNSLMWFINGTQLGSPLDVTGVTMPALTSAFIIGVTGDNYILFDELRISKGIARWTSNFTPPSAEYAPSAPTEVTLDFDDYPLSLAASGSLEFNLLDFSTSPLGLELSVDYEINLVVIDFSDYPFDMTVSGSLDEVLSSTVVYAEPFIVTSSFDPAFTADAGAVINSELPALTCTSEARVRSGMADLDLPALTCDSTGLVGEIGEVEANLPKLAVESSGYSNEFGSASVILPFLKISATGITGDLAEGASLLPALIMLASGYQIPLISVNSSIPALWMSASGHLTPVLPVYRATVLNLKNMSVGKYEDFNFNSLCFFRGVYLGANENGIYILGGDTDDGADIEWSFETPEIDLINSIPYDIWLSLRNKNSLTLKVNQNENIETPYSYQVDVHTDPRIHMERVKLGRGLSARVMQLTLSGTGEIELNQIAVVTNPLKKSKR